MRTFLFSCFFVAIATAILAQQASSVSEAPPVVVLFVGNSYTFGGLAAVSNYRRESVTTEATGKPADSANPVDHPADKSAQFGGVPAIFKKFSDQTGLHYEVHMDVSGGKSLEWHYKNTLPIIAQAKWNVVVLQSYSTEPVPAARGGKPENLVTYSALLEQAIHQANPQAKVYLYETFPRSDQVYPDKGPYHDSTVDAMAADLHEGYLQAFTKDGRFEGIAPAGDAWRKVFAAGLAQLNPYQTMEPGKFNLWSADNHHASIYGSYLNALVIFETITGQDVTKLGANEQAAHELGIAPEIAIKLQQIANETVRTGPHARK